MASFHPVIGFLAFTSLARLAVGETVWSSLTFTRTGERTPLADEQQESTNILKLTPVGAHQASTAGDLLRDRYLPTAQMSQSNVLSGLSPNEIDPDQLYILAADAQFNSASAQAFMQSFYPPFSSNNTSNAAATLANGSIVQYPMNGYQYPWVHIASVNDPESIFLDGSSNCPAFDDLANSYYATDMFQVRQNGTSQLYQEVGQVLGNNELPGDMYGFSEAYVVYDYLSYMDTYDATVHKELNGGSDVPLERLDQLRYLSDELQFALYGSRDMDVNDKSVVASTVAGQTLATFVVEHFSSNIATSGTTNKLALLFGEFPPFLSFADLANLPATNPDFFGMPDFASSMVFELYTNDTTSDGYPSTDDLLVRFLFRNGTDSNLVQYSLFNSGEDFLSFSSFQTYMTRIAMDSIESWCQTCNAWEPAVFCLAFNSSAWNGAEGEGNSATRSSSSRYIVSPGIAGAIGAVATLAVVGLLLFFAVGCLGVRFTRKVNPSSKQNLGGFKGGQKLASDPDVSMIKNDGNKSGAGISVVKGGSESSRAGGHERVGSWELKDSSGGLQKPTSFRRQSEEDRFYGGLGKEIRPDDRV